MHRVTKQLRGRVGDFNQDSHALNYQAVPALNNLLQTSLTKISTSCAKCPALKVKQSTSSGTPAELGSEENHATSAFV